MSEQRSPTIKPQTDEHRRRKGKTNSPGKPTADDYPEGKRFVARLKDGGGFTIYLLCSAIEAYQFDATTHWDDNGVNLFAVVDAVSDKRGLPLVGHLVKIHQNATSWMYKELRVDPMSIKEFNERWQLKD